MKRGPDAGDDVFALGIREELGIDLLFAGRGVAGEGNAGAAILAHVAEDHRLDVDGSAPLVGDAVHLTVDVGAFVVPTAEDGRDRFAKLNVRIGREIFPEGLLVIGLVLDDEVLELFGRDLGVELIAVLLLDFVEHPVHVSTGMALGDVREHEDEAAVAVIGKALIAAGLGEFLDGRVVETEVEDRVHHARHRDAGARANGDEERNASSAPEALVIDFLDLVNVIHDVFPHEIGDLLPAFVVEGAGFGRNGETSRDVDAGRRHFGEAIAFSAKDFLAEVLLGGFLEGEDVFLFCHVFLLVSGTAQKPSPGE